MSDYEEFIKRLRQVDSLAIQEIFLSKLDDVMERELENMGLKKKYTLYYSYMNIEDGTCATLFYPRIWAKSIRDALIIVDHDIQRKTGIPPEELVKKYHLNDLYITNYNFKNLDSIEPVHIFQNSTIKEYEKFRKNYAKRGDINVS